MNKYEELLQLSQDPEKCAGSTMFSSISSLFVAIATTILDIRTELNDVHNLHIAICPCFKFYENNMKSLKLSQDPEKCDRLTDSLTDGHTERKP
ncbi:hypothetical protein DPMN_172353 [Dreissena polymorpha]|uniref:Uncharacterized protein n=1 Tax=Dreissena polymorpha TaxID=45954 RepID=A0A9D4E0V8_DREPO|nr:hypothetical protein DPMN_172353 [Dreissena polymorpha]